MSILECELKKAEQTKHGYEAATEKLLAFVQGIKTSLSEAGNSEKSINRGPPGTSTSNRSQNINLLKDAKSVLKSVKPLLQYQGT